MRRIRAGGYRGVCARTHRAFRSREVFIPEHDIEDLVTRLDIASAKVHRTIPRRRAGGISEGVNSWNTATIRLLAT
jgi:hypothetical protein